MLGLILSMLIAMIGCWASSGASVGGCADLEQQLRACMDTPVCHFSFYLDKKMRWSSSEGNERRQANGMCSGRQQQRRTPSIIILRACIPSLGDHIKGSKERWLDEVQGHNK